MILSNEQIEKLLATAQQSIRLLGVVALDADWESLTEVWAKQLRNNPNFQIEILCESDNMLFTKSFTCDSDIASERRSFQELKFIRDRALELPDLLLEEGGAKELITNDNASQLSIEIMHLAIPISLVQVDDALFANLWLHEIDKGFEEINEGHPWYSLLQRYIKTYFDPKQGRNYAGEPDTELLELYDHSRTPRGIYPRSSFYDTDYSQLVVWALVFDREGRLLIHRRADNAKDNRSMWDKSVGGHVDFSLDVDTSRGVLREVIEELFSDEIKEKSKLFTAWAVTDEQMIYMGDWRPKQRRRYPFREISTLSQEWAFFRLKDSQHLYSPRVMPSGVTRRLRVISDVFLFVAGPGLTDETLGDLMNSEFKLITLPDLKNAMDRALRNEKVQEFDTKNEIPLFSPDLTNIMTGELRGVLEEFSQYVKRYVQG
jgi:hypothetical protein